MRPLALACILIWNTHLSRIIIISSFPGNAVTIITVNCDRRFNTAKIFFEKFKKLFENPLTNHAMRDIMYTTKGDKPNNERRKKTKYKPHRAGRSLPGREDKEMLIGKLLKEYPLQCLVKHYDKIELVPKSKVPQEWKELKIVHTYILENNFGKERVLVVK